MIYEARMTGRDWVELEVAGDTCHWRASGCLPFLRQVSKLRAAVTSPDQVVNFDFAVLGLELPLRPTVGHDCHGDLLLREVLLRARGEWKPPYQDVEICHCRAIPTQVVDQAIVCGARSPETVTRLTSAGSACGTCRGDTLSLIRYRWGGGK